VPDSLIDARALVRYEEWANEVFDLVHSLADDVLWQAVQTEDLGDWVEMLGTLVSFRPHVPQDKLEAAKRQLAEGRA